MAGNYQEEDTFLVGMHQVGWHKFQGDSYQVEDTHQEAGQLQRFVGR